jgi:perosamine synthetase
MIPVNRPLFISNEKKYLAKCIDLSWISSEGPFVKEFEQKFSKYVGKKYGVAVSSGTAALEVAMGVIGIKKGDEVIVPSFTIISCALAVTNYGGVPVFVDCDRKTWNIIPEEIEKNITNKTKAILVVHMYGHPCDMDEIIKIAKKHKLLIIEDCAEVHGAEYKNKKCGFFGDISCFSFYANKIISTGEGGMLLTNNKNYFEKAKSFRNLGFGKKDRFCHEYIAKNYRMTNLQAAVGVAQIKNIEKFIRIKRENAKSYSKALSDIPELGLPIEKPDTKNVYWMYGLVLEKSAGMDAKSLARKLSVLGIETRPFFYPMHLQPIWKKEGIKIRFGECKNSEYLGKYGFYLPSGLGLKKEEIGVICKRIRKIFNR